MSELLIPLKQETSPHTQYLHELAVNGNFSKRILDDFRLSFKYSLGSAYNQHLFFYFLGLHYFKAGPTVQQAVETSFATIPEEDWRKKAEPPRSAHQKEDREHIERESREEWLKFQRIASSDSINDIIGEMQADGIDHYRNMLVEAAYFMIRSDIKILEKGRPGRASHKKRFESFFREYVINKTPSGSPILNTIFQDMRQAVLEEPPTNIGNLASMWRLKNAEEDFYPHFYPEEFLETADQAGTQPHFDYGRTGRGQIPTLTELNHPSAHYYRDHWRNIGKGSIYVYSVSAADLNRAYEPLS